MDYTKLTRDKKAILSKIKKLPNKSLVASSFCQIMIPAKYVDKQLAMLNGKDKFILGVFAIIMGNNYAVMSIPNMVQVEPDSSQRVMVGAIEYILLDFEAGSKVVVTTDVVVKDGVVQDMYAAFIDFGISPWYLNYSDRLTMFDKTSQYAGITLGATPNIMQFIVTKITRDVKDSFKFHRLSLQNQKQFDEKPFTVVPFKSVIFGPNTTTAKLSGAYYDSAVQSALVSPSTKSDDIEKLLRM